MLRSTVTPPLFPYTTLFRSNGKSLPGRNERGEQIVDDVLLLLVNGAEDEQQFVLPQAPVNSWEVVLDTNGIASLGNGKAKVYDGAVTVSSRGLVLLIGKE